MEEEQTGAVLSGRLVSSGSLVISRSEVMGSQLIAFYFLHNLAMTAMSHVTPTSTHCGLVDIQYSPSLSNRLLSHGGRWLSERLLTHEELCDTQTPCPVDAGTSL